MKNVLWLIDVKSVSKKLIEAKTKERWVCVNELIDLVDENGDLKKYSSHLICKQNEEQEAIRTIKSFKGTKEQFVKQNPYCHVSTYPLEYTGYSVASFDKNDDIPCKIEFNDGYEYLDYFFAKFNNMRNDLIDKNQVVKDDDVYQYLYLVLDSLKKSEKQENKYQKIKKRFVK